MIKVKFACTENMNRFEEEMEFEDNVSDKDIEEAFVDWVWEQVGDHYYWERKE